jgi:gamma-glutamyltranspeptidase/glutathione hydrolase
VNPSSHGQVAAGHPATADAAAAMLRAGGNAFDAVIAAGFAATVAEPGFTSLAGGGYLLARTADGADRLVDFFVDTPGRGLTSPPDPVFDEVVVRFPAAVQTFHCGPGSVAVPGVLAGYLHAHGKLGRLPLGDVVAPAIALAEQGVAVSPSQAHVLELLEPILARTPASRATYLPHGRLLAAGDRLHNPDLGGFLRALAADPAATFYGGDGAARLAAQLHGGGGLVTGADLHAYRVLERTPLRVTYRGRTVVTNPPPTFGGCLLALALHRLEQAGPAAPWGSPARAEALRSVLAGIDADRVADHPEVVAALLGRIGPHAHDPARGRPDPGAGSGDGPPVVTRGTTHVTVADAEGNVAAMTTSNGECSGDVIDGTGILCNNMLGEDDLHPHGFHAAPPGVRVASMMSPTFVLAPDGAVDLALGSGGSKRIRSAVLQVLTAVVDHGIGLTTAVEAPRLHWDTDHTEVEPGLGADVHAALATAGPVNEWPGPSVYFGGVHAVRPGVDAAGDPRRGGTTRTT